MKRFMKRDWLGLHTCLMSTSLLLSPKALFWKKRAERTRSGADRVDESLSYSNTLCFFFKKRKERKRILAAQESVDRISIVGSIWYPFLTRRNYTLLRNHVLRCTTGKEEEEEEGGWKRFFVCMLFACRSLPLEARIEVFKFEIPFLSFKGLFFALYPFAAALALSPTSNVYLSYLLSRNLKNTRHLLVDTRLVAKSPSQSYIVTRFVPSRCKTNTIQNQASKPFSSEQTSKTQGPVRVRSGAA